MALLNMMYQSLFGGQSQRKMFFKVHVVYIEEGSVVYDWNDQQKENNVKFIIDICQKYNFSYTIIPLEKVYDISTDIDIKAPSQEDT